MSRIVPSKWVGLGTYSHRYTEFCEEITDEERKNIFCIPSRVDRAKVKLLLKFWEKF